MAAPPTASEASGGLREAMSCDVCSDVYEQVQRTPLVLPCGHTFCRACLTDIRKSGRFQCPTCRAGHNNLQVEALTVNYSLLNILPLCNQFECDKCATHGDDLRYWCANCDLPLCSICLYSGHPQGHTVKLALTFVTEKKQTLVDKINLIFRNIESHKKGFKADFNVLDKRVKKLLHRNACLQNIEGALQDLLADVKKANNITSVLYFEKSVEGFHEKKRISLVGRKHILVRVKIQKLYSISLVVKRLKQLRLRL
ncbi:tripartite motif-containing 13-like [Portunus trituberculatus]|uniref:tripartite motif-containing 13-like n=1 Tax=Portunus trituberculatus TaxID=210409 RepID=UPI001E1D07B9|nr:tripartite motif-containing 13-like [Portunus trituberculatus]XP_045130131.1 tripartite motif-containing 13-like [Portunus trituberculatus]